MPDGYYPEDELFFNKFASDVYDLLEHRKPDKAFACT